MSTSKDTFDPAPVAPDTLTFDERGLVPAVLQDAKSGEVLMLAWQNREAVARTLETGQATFFSRSRQALWVKGETSGNRMAVRAMATDCDRDAVLLRVDPAGPACHTGARACFFRPLQGAPEAASTSGETLHALEAVLRARQASPPEGSYAAKLFANATLRHKKVGEEATELVIASLSGRREEVVSEAADLLFHMLALLSAHAIGLDEVTSVLRSREGKRRP